jgi:luciferase family oxidoreductase group 1
MRVIPFSILDLSPIPQGSTAADALRNSLDLAQHAEALGYNRFWLAEHHNMPGIASAATSVVIGHVAGGTKTIRVGSGGIMLPNHSPLVIAEQFGTLASLYPGRIDLGLGRAPGTDQPTMRALRRNAAAAADTFPKDVEELQSYFADTAPGQRIRAVPGVGLHVPVWLLGSSTFSAELAAELGLPFAFASHFAPADMIAALHIYRRHFRPSSQLDRPYAMLGLNAIVADTDAEARRLFTSVQQAFTNLRRGTPGQIPPPIDDIDSFWTPQEKASASMTLLCSVVGSPQTVERGLDNFIEVTRPDEIIATAHIYDHAARLRSFELLSQISRFANQTTTRTIRATATAD